MPSVQAASPIGVDLARLLVGSEGTLALVTEVTLRTVPIPACQFVVVLPFGRISDAADAVVECLRWHPSACELFDWRSLRLARDVLPAIRPWISEAAESALILEFDGDDPDEVLGRLRGMVRKVDRRGVLAGEPRRSDSPGRLPSSSSGSASDHPEPDADERARAAPSPSWRMWRSRPQRSAS